MSDLLPYFEYALSRVSAEECLLEKVHNSQQLGGFPPCLWWAQWAVVANKWWLKWSFIDSKTEKKVASCELLWETRLVLSWAHTSSRRTQSCHSPWASSVALSVFQTPPQASASPEWRSAGRQVSRTDLPRCLIHCWQGKMRTKVISGIRFFVTWCGDHSWNKCRADSSFIHRTTLAISTIRILSFTIQLPNLPCCHHPQNFPDQMSKTTLWVTHINRKNVRMVKISLS